MEGIFADPRFGVFGYLSLICHHCCGVRDRGKSMPRKGLDWRVFPRLKQCIRATTNCCPDTESNDKFARKAEIGGGFCLKGGEKKRKKVELKNPRGPATLFPYITE